MKKLYFSAIVIPEESIGRKGVSIVAEKKEKRYVSDNARLMAEWHWEKNHDLGFAPNEITFGSIIKVWWVCDKGHEWEATPNNRSRGQGCPYCAGRKILPGFNDLATMAPNVISEWHPTKNIDASPYNLTAHSHKNIWWMCNDCGHEWQAAVYNRVAGKGCPICSKVRQGASRVQKHIEKNGSFAVRFPALLEEWDYSLNDISPEEISFNSNRRLWWKCKICSHSWTTTVYHRTVRKSGCPACSNKVTTKTNCLAVTHPHILKKWSYGKNTDISPESITAGSNRKVWWICDKGHEWCATVTAIVNGASCPICSGQKVLAGFNDLATINPALAQEWHPTKNGDKLPTQYTAGSTREKIWWICQRGHEYQARIAYRSNGTGCPICDKERKTSFPEQVLFYYLGLITTAENRYLYDGKTEIDIYLPEYNVGIEYDGYFYHSGEEAQHKESKKDTLLKSKGIRVIRVKETKDLDSVIDTEDVIFCKHDAGYKFLKNVIEKLIFRIGLNVDDSFVQQIDINKATPFILSAYLQYEKENSLAIKSPEIAKEWHPTRNRYVTPEMVSYASGRKVWWLGKCGHEWQMSIDSRKRGAGCPFCAGKRILIGFNDLQTTHPKLIEEWDYEKNTEVSPNALSYGSDKKVWWICDEGHSYQATPSNRAWGKGCPICGQVKSAKNRHLNYVLNNDCLDFTHPSLCSEWDQEKNGKTLPSMVTQGSDFKAWWICERGHSYQATVSNRVAGKGCPICSGHRIVSGINDLATLNPQLLIEWDAAKNTENPNTISPNSHKKAWWICAECGNRWQAEIHSRNSGVGCPECAKKRRTEAQRERALRKSGSLAERNPQLAAQWHPIKNEKLTPEHITPGSDYKAWWICPDCSYEWSAIVGNRNKGHGCPKCSRKKK